MAGHPCCPKTDRRGSCGLPTVVVQHPAEARATGDLAICPVVIRRSNLLSDELATDALVEPLSHIVLNEFLDQVTQMSLAEDDEVIETLVLDGFYKALRVWIAIWTLRRNLHVLHASRLQNRDERLGEQRISIVDHVLRAAKKTINWIRQIPSHLVHPRFAGVNGNPGDLDGATLELDDEEHHVPNRAESQDLHRAPPSRGRGLVQSRFTGVLARRRSPR